MGSHGDAHPNSEWAPVKIYKVSQAENTFAAGDSTDFITGSNWRNMIFNAPSQVQSDLIGERHSYGVNALMLDGRAAYYKKATILAGAHGDSDYYFRVQK